MRANKNGLSFLQALFFLVLVCKKFRFDLPREHWNRKRASSQIQQFNLFNSLTMNMVSLDSGIFI
jgi:hypothetical protein